jgi:cytochrome c-type biogenesis protein
MLRRFPLAPWLSFVLILLGTSVLIVVGSQLSQSTLYQAVVDLSFGLGDAYEQWFQNQSVSHPAVLVGLSFAGGVAASISPCILSMLPVNLSYIGTCDITSRRDALLKASAFVLGVVTVLSILGLFSALASLILIQFKGYFHLAVGLLIVVMALSLVGWLHLPLPRLGGGAQLVPSQSNAQGWRGITGPYSVGLTFALISSPCTSPIMFAVLAAAGASGSQFYSTLAMVSYALGYTAIIFFASFSAGLVKQSRRLLQRSQLILRLASFSLLLMGGFYLVSGVRWIVAVWSR